MNIKLLKKLQKARRFFLDESLVKSGTNNYKKFKYWELKDLVPCKQWICEKLEMETTWDFKEGSVGLLLWDLEQDDEQEPIVFTQQVSQIEAKNMMDMQDIGGSQTYVERYLLQQMFDIVDNDVVDSKNPDEYKKSPKQVQRKPKPVKKPKLVKKPEQETEPSIERINELAGQVGDRLYDNGRKSITKTNVANECDKMISEGLMNKIEKRKVVNLVQ